MKIKLYPLKNFDKKSINTIKQLTEISKKLLIKFKIKIPKAIEFYDDLDLFIKRILLQVKNYGLAEKQAKEFIKSSLNYGTYGTFDIKKNTIIEMNFNPHFKFFYPAIHFIKLLIHESLHLFLYSNIKQDIYKYKFKFNRGIYKGYEKIIQLDEGFAEFFTEKILEGFNFNSIKNLPIYSGLNKSPKYKKEIEGMNIKIFNEQFNTIYERNYLRGHMIIKEKFNQTKGTFLEKMNKIVAYIQNEIELLFKHE
jgi:hypothetical protein